VAVCSPCAAAACAGGVNPTCCAECPATALYCHCTALGMGGCSSNSCTAGRRTCRRTVRHAGR
jgi:hypothetical protein